MVTDVLLPGFLLRSEDFDVGDVLGHGCPPGPQVGARPPLHKAARSIQIPCAQPFLKSIRQVSLNVGRVGVEDAAGHPSSGADENEHGSIGAPDPGPRLRDLGAGRSARGSRSPALGTRGARSPVLRRGHLGSEGRAFRKARGDIQVCGTRPIAQGRLNRPDHERAGRERFELERRVSAAGAIPPSRERSSTRELLPRWPAYRPRSHPRSSRSRGPGEDEAPTSK